MLIIKIYFHLLSLIKKILYKSIYGNKITFGKHVTWRDDFHIMIGKNGNVSIGNNCFFNNDCSVNCFNKIEICENTIFGENVRIYDHDHILKNEKIRVKNQGYKMGEVHIGANCWIGSNVVILRNTTIGDNCIIGAGTVVKGKFDNNSKIIGKREYMGI